MLPQNKELKKLARDLRNNATKQERRLWYELLSGCSPRFNRQVVIMNYIADFYCAKAKLVIELDGSQHYTDDGIARDKAREDALNSLNLEVLRFSNLDIDQNFKAVCRASHSEALDINRVVAERSQSVANGNASQIPHAL